MSMSTPVKPTAKSSNKSAGARTRKAAGTKGAAPIAATEPSREEIARLAEKYWAERGMPHGSPEHDWIRAEQELMRQAS